MRKIIDVYILFAVIGTLNLLCTSGDKLAGATGTGNPPVVMGAVALIADTTGIIQSIHKALATATERLENANVGHTFDSIGISDDSNLRFNIESAKLIAQQLHFLTDSDPGKYTPRRPGMSYDSNKIIIEGPFAFDLMRGTCEPTLDSIHLPEASYLGIKLVINRGQSGNGRLFQNEGPAIEIEGTFNYNDTLHRFLMYISVNSVRSYEFEDSAMILNSKKSALFLLKLQTNRWLHKIALRTCLDNKNILFEQNGSLIIDLSTGVGPCRGVEAQIRENILNSGKLEVRQ